MENGNRTSRFLDGIPFVSDIFEADRGQKCISGKWLKIPRILDCCEYINLM